MEEYNHKTIFVLDHTQYFGISGDNTFQLEFVNSKGIDSVVPISKVHHIFEINTFYDNLHSVQMIPYRAYGQRLLKQQLNTVASYGICSHRANA